MPELSEAIRAQQTQPALLRAAVVTPEAAESLDDTSLWRKLGDESAVITTTQRESAIAAAEKLFYSSPLAHYLIEQYTDFVVGEGFELTSSNKDAQRVLYEFWHSPVNSIPRDLYYQVMEYFVYGELCYLKKDHADGFVSLTFVPPREIVSVTGKEGIPGRPAKLTLSSKDEYTVIDWDPIRKALVGDCFYFRMQHLGSDLRGYSRLLPLIDFLRLWETFTYNYLGKRANWDSIWWEVTLAGYTESQITEWLKANRNPPAPGSQFAHNELVTYNLVQPDFRHSELSADAGWYHSFLHQAAGLGTGEPSRRTREAGEILDPVARGLSARQWEVRNCYSYIGTYVLQQAIAKGALPDGTYDVICQAPRLGVRDFQRSSGALLRFVDALAKAEDRGYIEPEAASGIFQDMLSRLGMVEKILPLRLPEEVEPEVRSL